jgi:hypothetical protein
MELIAVKKNITRVPTDSNGHVAHQLDSTAIGVSPHRIPLLKTQPLDEGKKSKALIHFI